MADDGPDVITGTRPVLTRRNRMAVACAVVWLVVFVLFVIDRQKWTYLVILGTPVVVNMVRQLRPPVVVNSEGISRPWHRRSFLPWSSIDHIVRASYLNDVQVMGTDGCSYSVTGVDASLCDDVAALGGKPVLPHQVPTPRTITKEPTQREIEADVTRRAAALAAERQRMEDSNRQRRPRS